MRIVPRGAPILRAEQMRQAEERCFAAGTSQAELMERAGRAVAREVARLGADQPVLVLAGPGNNGGDAFVVARLLREWGLDVTVAAIGEASGGAARQNRLAWTGNVVPLEAVEPRPVLVDGLFGIGLSRPLAPETAATLHRLVVAATVSIAIDLPSGLDTDTGADLGAPRVTATVALGALKPAHVTGAGADFCGHLLLADIGVPVPTSHRTIARPGLRRPGKQAHKYTRGLVVVVQGSMPGASHLAARAALHGGAGYVILAGSTPPAAGPDALVFRNIANADGLAQLLGDSRIGAVVLGPGLGRDARAEAWLEAALGSDRAMVLDGDALSLMGEHAIERLAARGAATLLTPHGGEFASLFGSPEPDRLTATQVAAQRSGTTVIHKGADTVIASPDGTITVAADASSWLSTAGSGDVLAGLVAARHAAGGSPCEAVWLHTQAARRAGAAFSADNLIAHVAPALEECLWTVR